MHAYWQSNQTFYLCSLRTIQEYHYFNRSFDVLTICVPNARTIFKVRVLSFINSCLGIAHLLFPKSGNHYTWRKVATTVHNIIVGRLWVDNHGDMDIVNHNTNDRCHLKYMAYSYFSREAPRKVFSSAHSNSLWVFCWHDHKQNLKLTESGFLKQKAFNWLCTALIINVCDTCFASQCCFILLCALKLLLLVRKVRCAEMFCPVSSLLPWQSLFYLFVTVLCTSSRYVNSERYFTMNALVQRLANFFVAWNPILH